MHNCDYCGKMLLVVPEDSDWISWKNTEKVSCPACFIKAKEEEVKFLEYKINYKTNNKPPVAKIECTAKDLIKKTLSLTDEYKNKQWTDSEYLSQITDIGFKHINFSNRSNAYYGE